MLFNVDFSIQYVLLLFLFRDNKSFLKTFIIIEVGVTTKKKTAPITIGHTKFPSIIPNLNQILFNGDKIGELNNPKIKKIIDKIIDQVLILSLLSKGYKDTIKKTTKKTIPKLLLELIDLLFILVKIIIPFNK